MATQKITDCTHLLWRKRNTSRTTLSQSLMCVTWHSSSTRFARRRSRSHGHWSLLLWRNSVTTVRVRCFIHRLISPMHQTVCWRTLTVCCTSRSALWRVLHLSARRDSSDHHSIPSWTRDSNVLISPDFWPPNSSNLDYKIWGIIYRHYGHYTSVTVYSSGRFSASRYMVQVVRVSDINILQGR